MNLFIIGYLAIALGTFSLLYLLILDYGRPVTAHTWFRIVIMSAFWFISYIALFIYICHNEYKIWRSLKRLQHLEEEDDYENESD